MREKMYRHFLTGAIVMVNGIGLFVCGLADQRRETGGLVYGVSWLGDQGETS